MLFFTICLTISLLIILFVIFTEFLTANGNACCICNSTNTVSIRKIKTHNHANENKRHICNKCYKLNFIFTHKKKLNSSNIFFALALSILNPLFSLIGMFILFITKTFKSASFFIILFPFCIIILNVVNWTELQSFPTNSNSFSTIFSSLYQSISFLVIAITQYYVNFLTLLYDTLNLNIFAYSFFVIISLIIFFIRDHEIEKQNKNNLFFANTTISPIYDWHKPVTSSSLGSGLVNEESTIKKIKPKENNAIICVLFMFFKLSNETLTIKINLVRLTFSCIKDFFIKIFFTIKPMILMLFGLSFFILFVHTTITSNLNYDILKSSTNKDDFCSKSYFEKSQMHKIIEKLENDTKLFHLANYRTYYCR